MSATRAYIGLGGNVGDTAATLRGALDALNALPQTSLVAVSQMYRSPPWGPIAQPDFTNAAAAIDTALPPLELMQAVLGIVLAAGRVRRERGGPRALELVLLVYGDMQAELDGLSLPHPRIAERAFVLLPLLELAPNLHIPGHGALAELSRWVDRTSVVALG